MNSRCVVALVALASGLRAQQDSSATPNITLRGGTEEVLLDFIVRDKHQKLIEDLKPGEVQIFEDGARQTPRSFVFRSGGGTGALPSSARSNGLVESATDPLRQINLVTLVFESMSPLSRRTAVERAHEFLKAEAGPNTWMAVYSLHYQLSVQQTYTTDIALLNRAVDRAGSGAYEQFAKENLDVVKRLNSLESSGSAAATFQPLDAGSAEELGPQNDGLLAAVEIPIQQLILKTLFQQEGIRSIDALRRLVREQARLPGRKTIVFFSEGLVIPPSQPELLESVIAEANRGNVTFYTVDARGLGTVSNLRLSESSARAIVGAEQSSVGLSESGRGTEAIYQTDLQANARRLAQGTGGFAMDNSNDLRGPLIRVMEEIRSHYEVTYAPTSKDFDGHFRKLEVKLDRPGLKVQSRAGYYALPMVNGETIAPYELAALNAINMDPAPRAFPYIATALQFGETAGEVDCRIVFSVPGNFLHFTRDPSRDQAKNTFRIRISVFGLVKDEHGQIVAKVGKDLPFSAPVEKESNFTKGKVTLTLPVRLPPGSYQLQTAVIDREAERTSVKRSVLIVPAHAPGSLAVSDLVLVRSVESVQTPEPGNPMETLQGRITPDLEPALPQNDTALFYFVVFPQIGATDQPDAQVTVARDGKALASFPLAKPQADERGAYRYSGSLPLKDLEPGEYKLTAMVAQSGVHAGTRGVFAVTPSQH